MQSKRFRRTKLAGLLGAGACVLLLVLAAHSGLVHGQTSKNSQKQLAAGQSAPGPRSAEANASADDQSSDHEDPSADDDGPSPGNFLGSTYIPSNLGVGVSMTPGTAGQMMAGAPPPPKPVPADAGGDPKRQQINNETANLLAMVYALKAEVDKSNKDELSIAVVRKANQVEQLARKVRDEMRPTSGKN